MGCFVPLLLPLRLPRQRLLRLLRLPQVRPIALLDVYWPGDAIPCLVLKLLAGFFAVHLIGGFHASEKDGSRSVPEQFHPQCDEASPQEHPGRADARRDSPVNALLPAPGWLEGAQLGSERQARDRFLCKPGFP